MTKVNFVRAVYISFFTNNIFSRKGVASLKQHNMRKRIFTYDEMTSEKWSKFQQDIDTEYNNSNEINKDWNRRSRYITELTLKHHYKDLTIPLTLNNNNIVAFRHSLKKFHRVLQHKHSLLYAQHNNEQICKFIQQCCEDYHGNQSHMIDSFLAREKRTIVIDRVLQTVDNHQTLVTDPTEIKQLTNTHFQTCPGGI